MNDESRWWHGPAVAALLNIFGELADLVIVRSQHQPWWPNVASAGVSACVLALLLAGWRSPRFVGLAFLVHNAAIVAALWITDAALARNVVTWTPFRPHELGILAVALLSPPELSVGLANMALFAGAAVGEWASFGPELRSRTPPGQMIVLAIYVVFGVTLLIYRLRALASERARVRAETEAAGLDRLARTLLAVRDLANSPLQTLEISAALLREDAAAVPVVVERIERAVASLRQTQQALSRYDAFVSGQRFLEAFDPLDVLRAAASPPDQRKR